MTLEKQSETLPRRRQQKLNYDEKTYMGRLARNTLELPRKSPRYVLKTPKRSSRTSSSEEYAYDGPQAFETGNPDSLDAQFRVKDCFAGKIESTSSIFDSPKANETPKSHHSLHLPSIRSMKIQLPKTPQTGGDRRSLFDSMETDDAEDSLAAEIRPKVRRRKIKASGAHRRHKSSPPRPHSATEMIQRPQVKTSNPIEFGGDEIGMETSLAFATPALRSVASSAAISFKSQEKLKKSEGSPRRRRKREGKESSARSAEGRPRGKRRSPSKCNSSISVTKRRTEKRSTTGKSKREKATAQSEMNSSPMKNKRTFREDRNESLNDILPQNEVMQPKGEPRKIKMGVGDSSPQKATQLLDRPESCLGDYIFTQQKKHIKSQSETCIPNSVTEESENRKRSPTRRIEFKKKERESILKDEEYGKAELRSAVARIFKAVDQVESFIKNPAPKGMTIRCRITRDKNGIEGGLFPSYYLYLESREDRRRFFLLSARRKRRAATCTYFISMDAINTSSGENRPSDSVYSNTEMNSYNFGNGGKMSMGCLRSNFLGTQFVLSRDETDSRDNLSGDERSREIAAIAYEPNLLGFKGPRKMTVLLQTENDFKKSTSSKELSKYLAGLPDSRNDSSGILELHNKKPMWNEQTQSYVLNFHGRVTHASVKNFQLIDEKDESMVLMQFGRVSDKHFTMDYGYPLSALQAFGIAISSLTGKLACE